MTQKLRALTAIAATAVLAVASNISDPAQSAPAADGSTPRAADGSTPRAANDSGARAAVGDVLTSAVEEPSPIDVRVRRSGRAEGELFITPQALPATHPVGPQIADDQGRPIWFHKLPEGYVSTDFRVQEYRGEKVLTWWEGKATNTGMGTGIAYIANENYEIIATVQTPDPGQVMDMHEFLLTDEGTALIISYQPVPYDLSPVGGPKDGIVINSVVQEIDIATGEKLMNWSALEHVPLNHSDVQPSPERNRPYDYLHVNSVGIDTDGNLLISGNAASTVYKVDRETGDVIWRLGGRNSDFRLGVGVRFMWQHDVQAVGNNTYRVFDNANKGTERAGYESRVAWIRVDPARGRAELVRQQVHPDLMSATLEGGSQALGNGNTFVSWGKSVAVKGRISEFTRNGRMVYDATLPDGDSSYRAYRLDWEGEPLTKPQLLVGDAASNVVHANWNGASDVARWRLLAGPADGDLKPVTTAAWDGFDTPLTVPAAARDADRLQVQALDARGKVIAASPVTPATEAAAGEN
ncbi:arylsulfotransferase family protein [Streptomyces sp. NPDC088387]|uniref:arylsulfotransferase family protein n=1 Tax=Streptomyces sp. NPDC088387 TaxID=3365859 RepID=UPI0037FCE89F